MIKRQFGMKVLNITQGRYGTYSHKGLNAYDLGSIADVVEYFYAPCNLLVTGVLEYKKTGFANTVLFYDVENNVTLALTHIDNLMDKHKVGTVIESGSVMYASGTKGNATGKHIHLEIGSGKQYTKSKVNGVWQLKNLINIEDYFYINEQFTKKIINKRYAFTEQKKDGTTINAHVLHTASIGLYLRDAVQGAIIRYIQPYSSYSFDEIKPLDNIQKDGYQWFIGVKNDTEYYFQFDTKFYWIN